MGQNFSSKDIVEICTASVDTYLNGSNDVPAHLGDVVPRLVHRPREVQQEVEVDGVLRGLGHLEFVGSSCNIFVKGSS